MKDGRFVDKHLAKIIQRRISNLLFPPPDITGSQWANEKRILSREDSSEPGKYSTERSPFQLEILDEFTNPYSEIVVAVLSRQIGKTLMATNAMGYYIDYDPSPIMYMIETLDKAENFSKVRLDAMIRDNTWMQIDRKIKTSGNTILSKHFPGGYLSMVGANSPSGLASKVIRVLIADEVDGYPMSAGSMGSPLDLAKQTTETFDNRKIILISSPGVEGESKIWPAYLESDQRAYHVPCPECGFYQILVWEQMRFPDRKPENCFYECRQCKTHLTDREKFTMISEGQWIKKFPERINRPGFHLSRLYSVFSSWSKMVDEFLSASKASHEGDPGPLQVFYNASLAKIWKPYSPATSATEIIKRAENYVDAADTINSKIVLITAGIDVQDDRFEIEITGWGIGEESWLLEYKVFSGEPALPGMWNELDEYLKKRFKHPSGLNLGITASCIDTGGHYSSQVYNFVRGKHARRIYGIKGSNQPGKSIAPKRPSYNNKGKIPLYFIGTNSAKEIIYTRLRITEAGPGYLHFDKKYCDEEYFNQLISNKKTAHKSGGQTVFIYDLIAGRRDEALDCKVYSYAALKIYNRDLNQISKLIERVSTEEKSESSSAPPKNFIKKPFATNWK